MRVDYPDGSFMLSWEFARAWYNADGTLKDAEYKRGATVRAVSAKHTKVRAHLEKQGKQEADLLARGILKRKRPARMLPFMHGRWHLWQTIGGSEHFLLSDEDTGTLREFADADSVINWLFLADEKPAARALNAHIKANPVA